MCRVHGHGKGDDSDDTSRLAGRSNRCPERGRRRCNRVSDQRSRGSHRQAHGGAGIDAERAPDRRRASLVPRRPAGLLRRGRRPIYTSASTTAFRCPGVRPLSWQLDAELAHEGAASPGRPAFPVIVFSHGSVNDPINSAHLLERIAARGVHRRRAHARHRHAGGRANRVHQHPPRPHSRPQLQRRTTLPPACSGFTARARARTTPVQARMVERHATSSTPWTHCPAGWAPAPT